jgi:hypothetical protein
MLRGILFKLAEDCGPLQIFARAGTRRINRFPPSRAILLIDELSDGNFGKIRIA